MGFQCEDCKVNMSLGHMRKGEKALWLGSTEQGVKWWEMRLGRSAAFLTLAAHCSLLAGSGHTPDQLNENLAGTQASAF